MTAGLAPKTVRSVFNAMKMVFKFGVKWEYVKQNPMSNKLIELPRGSTKRLKKPVQLSPAQFFLLLSNLSLQARLAVALAGWLGPRRSEAFGLRWSDIDLNEGVVSFVYGFVDGRLSPLKTEASRTNLPVPEEVQVLLREWLASTAFTAANDWLFASPSTKGKRPYWPGQFLKSHVQPVAARLGLPKVGWHAFRHSVSAWAKEAGLELEQVKTLLRHENLATTSQVYGAPQIDAKRAMQQRLVAYVLENATPAGGVQ